MECEQLTIRNHPFVNHEWGTTTTIDSADRRCVQRVTLHAGGFSGLCRRQLAAVDLFVELGGIVVETSTDRGENCRAFWIPPNASATIRPGLWFRLVSPDRQAAGLLVVRGFLLTADLQIAESGGLLPTGGSRRSR